MEYLYAFTDLLNEMSPYLLLGFFVAGLLHVYVPQNVYANYFSGNDLRSVCYAALFGIPLPLCSCGVIPTAMSLRREGASRGAATSFLIATPQTGVDSIIATYSLMGLPFAVLRPIAALLTSVVGGCMVNCVCKEKDEPIGKVQNEVRGKERKGGLKEVFRYGYVEMLQDIGKRLVLGLILAGLITIFVPESFFVQYADSPLKCMALVLLFSVPMYLCATGSIPIAVALMLKGLSPGAVLVAPMVMKAWNNAGMRNVFTENGNNYRGAMAEVADEMKCAFVDLNMKSYNLFKTTSANYCSRFFYHTYPAGEYPNYPNGSSDGTHFQEMGALTLCKLVTDGLKESKDPFIQSLVNYMKPQYTLTVKANKDKSGDITMSNSFPEGAPITVKVLPSNGSKFVNWSRDGKNVSSKTLYRFSMGSQNTELTAIFEGGAAVDTVVKIDFPEGKKRVAYITDPNAANYANDTKILPALKACDSLFVYEVNAAKNNVDLADFDMVVISEVAASTAARIASLKNADKPTLTMKVHAYKEAAGAWGWAENGFGDNYEATNVTVSDAGKGHPIFSGVKLSESGELQMVSEVNDKALTYMNPANFSSVSGGEIVELASISGEEQCSIFEIPAGTTVSGTTLKSAMVQVGLNSSSYANITEDGVKVLQNACYYLLGMKMPAEEATDVTSVNADACAVYPNLVRDVLFVRNGTDEVFSANLTLTSLNGSVLAQMMVTLNEGVNSISRDGLSVPAGLYVVSLTDKKGSELFKGITIFK